jgi:tRNA U54 and U55 pseudouridine synthase Pus10
MAVKNFRCDFDNPDVGVCIVHDLSDNVHEILVIIVCRDVLGVIGQDLDPRRYFGWDRGTVRRSHCQRKKDGKTACHPDSHFSGREDEDKRAAGNGPPFFVDHTTNPLCHSGIEMDRAALQHGPSQFLVSRWKITVIM